MSMDAAAILAEHVAGLRFEDLSDAAVERAKVFVLDSIGVGIAGATAEGVQPLIDAASCWGDGGKASLWGHALKLPAPQAVMVNAYQLHSQEYDCLHEGAVVHAMATLLPVLLADAELRGGINGRALITAVAAGADVAARLGLASTQPLRFFRPATAGGFGAVAGLARLRGHSAAEVLSCFGIQYGQTSGTMQAHTEGSTVLPLQVGVNARAAWQSADLVAAGFSGPREVFEGRYGYLRLMEGEWEWGELLQSLGRRWMIAEFSHKPWPAGRATHGGIEGVLALQVAHGFTAEQVDSVLVTGPSLINRLVNRPDLPAPTANYARLCMPFIAAKAILHGSVDIAHCRGEALADAATHALAARIGMAQDDNPDANALAPQVVEVRLRDGRVLRHDLPAMLASPARPLAEAQHLAKFERCCSFAARPLAAGEAQRLVAAVDALELCADIRALIPRH